MKQLSLLPPVKLALYGGMSTMFTLGFYRGCKEYYTLEMENSKTKAKLSDFACCSIFGLIGASTYINPAFTCFAIRHEYLLAKVFITGRDDENIADKNLFFSFHEKKRA